MAKGKISITDALKALRDQGLEVTVRPAEPTPVDPGGMVGEKPVKRRIGSTAVTITLYAAHTVGCGGNEIVDDDGNRSIQAAGVQSYGPGVVTVPTRLATHLLHQDQLAREADARFLTTERRSFLIAEKIGPDGQRVRSGVRVANELLDSFDLTRMPYTIMVR